MGRGTGKSASERGEKLAKIAAFCLFLWLACLAPGAEAKDGERLPAVVRIADPADDELLNRVRGQTNDLDVEVLSDDSLPLESDLGGQLAGARALSAKHAARVVVWFVREDTALTVFVSEPSAGRVLVRRLERAGEHMGSSAQNEAAALVVRSAMRSLAQGGEIGVAEKEVAPPPPPAPEPEPAPEPVEPPPPEPLPPGWELIPHIGARAGLDGASDQGSYGFIGRLAIRYRNFQAELRGAIGWPSTVDDDVAKVRLIRHAASIHGVLLPVATDRFVLGLGLGGGVNVYLSNVNGKGSGFQADDRAIVLSAVAADVTFRYMPGWARGRVGLAMMMGAEVLPIAPAIGYFDENGTFLVRDRMWNVLPQLTLELAIRMR